MALKNVTLAFDEELLSKARALAKRRHTTLNAMIRSVVAQEIEQDDRVAWAKAGMRKLIEESPLDLGPDYKWGRQELYAEREDRLLSRHERSSLRGGGEES